MPTFNKRDSILAALIVSLSVGCFLTFMDWLFFITKASFFSSLSHQQTIEALVIVSLLTSLLLALTSLTIGAALFPLKKLKPNTFLSLTLLPLTLALSACALLLIDNFTNTMFGYGVAKTDQLIRFLYFIGFAFILTKVHRALVRHVKRVLVGKRYKAKFAIAILGAVTIPMLVLIVNNSFDNKNSNQTTLASKAGIVTKTNLSEMPNIIFFATDGISAKLTSAYGNSNQTTPALDKIVPTSLVAEHAFTNSERTTGSTTSMLTGKYPATTKVLFPPHILNNKNSYQHLPGVLKALGYQTMQESVRYYADALDLNMLDSFDQVNGRTNSLPNLSVLSRFMRSSKHSVLFMSKIIERISQRVLHILFIENMQDVYASVKSNAFANVYGVADQLRIDRGVDFIRNTDKPFFMHLHLMDTHCCTYRPKQRVFSNRTFNNKKNKRRALLEDSLRVSDGYFEDIIRALKQSNKFDNTIIVYSSDHTEGWGFTETIPLLIMFPDGRHKGKINKNVQLLDVAPTILDYLKVDIPQWMEGQSLLTGSISAQRPIFGITKLERERFKSTKNERLSRIVGSGPPAYGLNTMAMVVCNKWYVLDLNTGSSGTGTIKGYSSRCDEAIQPSLEMATGLIKEHLSERQFSFSAKN